ncbi:transcription factor bHLH130 [Canna indica]|uniref:Transcription factor bHLH130 n=1 Tax=Canna indica TaxID=4628 RepID=A0AAQ3KTS9_9LILI|nr:transcription factor bHLH130 [Canna indica]
MYGSPPPAATSKGPSFPHTSTAPSGGHCQEESESEHLCRRHQQQQMSSSLLRFQSAPSSLLGELCEAENRFARFLAPDPWDKPSGGSTTADYQRSPQFQPPPPLSSADKVAFSSAPPMMYHQLQMPNQILAESSIPAAGSIQQIEMGGGRSSSSLTRQNSSPAGFFSHLNADNGYGMIPRMTGFRNGDLIPPMRDAANRLHGQTSFSSRQSSIMSQISEMGSEEEMGRSAPDETSDQCFIQGAPVTSWEETSLLSGNKFSGLKRGREEEKIIAGLNLSESQNGEVRRGHASNLTHQFSLPKTSSEMSAIENFYQFQDAVPCRIRAKRGCATHPRSIAERVRRTKISERMRKLQDLVPNMDKQTNTADMLDLAVDYIKDLQRQVKILTESQANCTCSSSKQKPYITT